MADFNKVFQLRCKRCLHSEFSSGLTVDLAHLAEIKKCANCGGKRTFRCPKCGGIYLMNRIAGNHEVKPAEEK